MPFYIFLFIQNILIEMSARIGTFFPQKREKNSLLRNSLHTTKVGRSKRKASQRQSGIGILAGRE
jgi:hypothetical protein